MRNFDLSPFTRSTIGFDRLSRLMESTLQAPNDNGFPPYDIEKSGADLYRITMAVAGYGAADLVVSVDDGVLSISGKSEAEPKEVTYLHRGIARRAFARRFNLAETVKVVAARLENGLLIVDLANEIPEARKPRRIEIQTSSAKQEFEQAAA